MELIQQIPSVIWNHTTLITCRWLQICLMTEKLSFKLFSEVLVDCIIKSTRKALWLGSNAREYSRQTHLVNLNYPQNFYLVIYVFWL